MNRYDPFQPPRPAGPPRPRGGRRAGAGRPPAYTEPLVRKTVTLPGAYVTQLTAFGAGNLSEGIRYLVEFAYTREGRPWFVPVPPAPESPTPGGPPPR
jgi:hypothetical protein